MKLSKESAIKNKTFEHETLTLAFSELISMSGKSIGIAVSDEGGIDVIFNICETDSYSVTVEGDRLLFKESINLLTYENLRRFAWRVFRITIVVELLGTAMLYGAFAHRFSPLVALGHAFFHSVSAFCNAGFSTFAENMALFSYSIPGPLIVAALFIFGGIGFVVVSDLYTTLIKREKKRREIALSSERTAAGDPPRRTPGPQEDWELNLTRIINLHAF